MRNFGWKRLLGFGLLLLASANAWAQSARVSGFVTDSTDGRPLELVNVVLTGAGEAFRGAVTGRNGLYQFARLEPGRYRLQASFVGYRTFADTLDLVGGDVRTVNISLAPGAADLDEVVVQTERLEGMARVTAGQQTIRPEEIELIPTPDVSGDLASYLTTLPGVVSTGDRGGQLFIRGGEPSQNLVLLDGMTLYQPFHLVGFYSAFPSSILQRADVYAGGYGSKFGERISSVIDVWTREGNKRRFAGSATVSPFTSSALLEGPIVPGSVSFLASVRQSLVEESAPHLIGDSLPFTFGDAFVKLHANVTRRSRLAASAVRTHDRGTLHANNGLTAPEEIRWRNQAFSFRWLILPRLLPVSAELRLAYSRLESELGPRGEPTRTSEISNTHLTLDATFPGDRTRTEAGMAVRFVSPSTELGGLFQNVEARGGGVNHVAFYIEPEFTLGLASGELRVRPGGRLEFYAIQLDPVLEPRLRLVWVRGKHQISGAAGLYHQEIVGLVDQRDAASVFTAWTSIPRYPRQENLDVEYAPQAIHAILGYQVRPASWLEGSIEGFYKKLDHLFVGEWTPYPRMTTNLQPATGRAFGFDARLEARRPPFYAYVNYGLSSTRYEARQATLPLWFGEEAIAYRPAHDRRHQVNALVNVKAWGFDLSARWAFGSGLPFSRPVGFDGFVLVDDPDLGPGARRFRRALYGRPFNAELPTYHRLDLSLERTFRTRSLGLTVLGSLINTYGRRNIFYVDVFTLQRTNQLPLLPSLGLKVSFNESE